MDYEKAFHAQATIVNALRKADPIDADVLHLVCEQVCAVLDAHNVIVMQLKDTGFETIAHAQPADERTQYAEAYIREGYVGKSFTRDDVAVLAAGNRTAWAIISDEWTATAASWADDMVYQIESIRLRQSGFEEHTAIYGSAMKNSLAPIVGYCDLLILAQGKFGPLSDEQQEFMEIMKYRARRAQDLHQDYTHLISIISGGPLRNAEKSVVNIDDVLTNAILPIQHLAREKAITIDVEIDSGLDVMEITGDRNRLWDAFQRVIDNALKYSNNGDRISVQVQPDPARADHIRIVIADNGPGIYEQDGNRIFFAYYRGSNADVRRRWGSGMGLGLYFAREIIKAHHGHIWYESEPGKGSTFYVSLPRTQPE
ncbi:MAG: HAMP domain-containing sensor histidine kinase [Chloroflexota bacterium]